MLETRALELIAGVVRLRTTRLENEVERIKIRLEGTV